MAISNALGSNTFNIYICLGLPWLFYTAAYNKPYDRLQNGGKFFEFMLLI